MKRISIILFSGFFSFALFSSCQKELSFDAIPLKSKIILQGNPGLCSNAVVSGNYYKDSNLDVSNKVALQVNVISPGSFNIQTNTINGYSFSATGNFTSTGAQTITLVASGKPIAVQTDNFIVTLDSSLCNFSIQITVPPVPIFTTHFPLTTNSFWTYNDLPNAPDTFSRTVTDSGNINGFLYKTVSQQNKFGPPVLSYFRRQGNNYFENALADKYTVSFKFLPTIQAHIPFLKENLVTGQTWSSDEYIGPASFGQLIYFRYDFVCDDANASVIINGTTYNNVYKMRMLPQIRSATTYPYNSTSEIYTIFYAKDIGVIYSKLINNSFTISESQIRNYHVN